MKPIVTLRNGTAVLVTTGDRDAFKYGGGVVYKDGDGTFWQFWDSREPGEKNYFVYTAPVPNKVLDHYDATLEEICSVGALDRREVRRLARSSSPSDRSDLVAILRESRGPSGISLKGECETLSPFVLADRWGCVFGVEIEDVPKADLDDYIVREHAVGYECGRVDGLYLGRFETYEEALTAVANDLQKCHSCANLFHEHAKGHLELVDWDSKEHAGRASLRRKKLPTQFWKNSMKLYSDEFRAKLRRARKPKTVKGTRRRETSRRAQERMREHARSIRRSFEAGIQETR